MVRRGSTVRVRQRASLFSLLAQSAAGIAAHRQRMADAEGVIGELKNRGTAERAQRRGTPHYHVQLLLNCTAVNYKRLADHASQVHGAAAAATQTQPPAAAARATTTQQPAIAADRNRWLAALLAAAPRAWDYAISLN